MLAVVLALLVCCSRSSTPRPLLLRHHPLHPERQKTETEERGRERVNGREGEGGRERERERACVQVYACVQPTYFRHTSLNLIVLAVLTGVLIDLVIILVVIVIIVIIVAVVVHVPREKLFQFDIYEVFLNENLSLYIIYCYVHVESTQACI